MRHDKLKNRTLSIKYLKIVDKKEKKDLNKNVLKEKKIDSPAGNRTRVFHVTGGDTHHYTTEDHLLIFTSWPKKSGILLNFLNES